MPPSHRQRLPSGDVDGTAPPPPLPLFKLVANFLVGIVWAAIYLGRWFETRFLHPVADFFLDVALTSAEEGAKSLLREAFAALSRGNLQLLLSPMNGPGGASRPMPDGARPAPGGWNRIVLNTTDLKGDVERLRKQGVRFRNDIVVGLGGSEILLEDPSGNPVELFQPDA